MLLHNNGALHEGTLAPTILNSTYITFAFIPKKGLGFGVCGVEI